MPQWLSKLKNRHLLPAGFFLAGFTWDALTLGQRVQRLDLLILLSYMMLAALLLWYLGHRHAAAELLGLTHSPSKQDHKPLLGQSHQSLTSKLKALGSGWRVPPHLPYLALQFLYGGLLSALFIFYFKSAGQLFSLLLVMMLGGLLILNEFLHSRYAKFTLTWALFGLCAMLLCNFLLPYLLGSLHSAWFYLSTLLGGILTTVLRNYTPHRPGRIFPVWLIAVLLMLAYAIDAIPPVPLVKKSIEIGTDLQRAGGGYRLQIEQGERWLPVRWVKPLHLTVGQRAYCLSAVYAPKGMHTRLYHVWQAKREQGWQTVSKIGFSLSGGRDGGFRGYTYKQSLGVGQWRIKLETEDGRTLAIERFEVIPMSENVKRKTTAYIL